MVKTNSKVIRLNSDTLDLIENYRYLLIGNTINNHIRKYIEEESFDKIIRSAVLDAINYCTKS